MLWLIRNRKILVVVFLLTVGFAAINNSTMTVFAAGGAKFIYGNVNSSGGSAGGKCDSTTNAYAISCAKTSWVFYSSKEGIVPADVQFPYINGNSGKTITIPKECAEHTNEGGGFWHYGNNAKGMNFYGGNQYGGEIQVPGSIYGHWSTLRWGTYNSTYEAPLTMVNQEIGGIYKATRSANSATDVLKEYQAAWKADGNADVPSSIPSGLSAFCYWGGMDDEYFTRTEVSAAEGNDATDVTNNAKATAPTVNISVGDYTPIIFYHDVYSSKSGGGQNAAWEVVQRVSKDGSSLGSGFWTGENKGYYNIASTYTSSINLGNGRKQNYSLSTSSSSTAVSGTVTSFGNSQTQGKYLAASNFQQSFGNKQHTAGWILAKVTFKQEGTYEFCEYITIGGTKSTEGCVKVVVGPKSGYGSKSNVKNSSPNQSTGSTDAVSTDVQSSPETAKTSLKITDTSDGEKKATIVFSHDVVANTYQNANTTYKMERTLNGSPGFSSDDFTISSGSTDSSTGDISAEFTSSSTLESKGKTYYWATPHDAWDGGYHHNLRDVYDITFKNAGAYEFCEKIYIKVGSEYEEFTSACATITVGKGGSPTPVLTCKRSDWPESKYVETSTDHNGRTGVVAATRNSDVAEFNVDWIRSSRSKVYAKPGDLIKWLHCYYPGVQKVAKTTATQIHPGHGNSNNSNTNKWMSQWDGWANYFRVTNVNLQSGNKYFGSFTIGDTTIREWNDTYSVETGMRSRAGKILTETNTSSPPGSASVGGGQSHSWDCRCKSCNCDENGCDTCCDTCWHTNQYFPNSRSGPVSDTATVYVPYNYENSIAVGIDRSNSTGCGGVDDDHVVCAGEKVTMNNATVTVSSVYNEVTKGDYATRVDGSETRLYSFAYGGDGRELSGASAIPSGSYSDLCSAINGIAYASGCALIDVDQGDSSGDCVQALNCDEDTGGTTEYKFTGRTYNVYDIPAGYWYCVVAAVYPASSGASQGNYTNMNGSPGNAGDNRWAVSTPDCVQVVKQPTMQVWGNSLYTSGGIVTSETNKRVVAGFYPFYIFNGNRNSSSNTNKNSTYFGSWVEQSIFTSKSMIFGLASGAATGRYSSGNNNDGVPSTRTPMKRLGGSHDEKNGMEDFCVRSPLTIPNANCKTYTNALNYNISTNGYSSIKDVNSDNKESILGRYFNETDFGACVQNTGNVGDESKLATVCYKSDGALSIGGVDEPKQIAIGKTYLYYATNEININGDILYPYNDGSNKGYSSLYEIPKVIIYSGGDITINCSVRRVDAVLIANGNIDTCPEVTVALTSNSNIPNDVMLASSTQLKIFGTIITNTMTPSRTYGAATGKYSGVPAEIIDYDTSLYLWGMSRATVNKSGKAEVTYQTELSPRY